jgi:hypothetical protein
MSKWIQRFFVLGVLMHATVGHAQYQRGSSNGNFIGMSASGFSGVSRFFDLNPDANDGPESQYITSSDTQFASAPSTGTVGTGTNITNPVWDDGRQYTLRMDTSASARLGVLKAFASVIYDPDEDYQGEGGTTLFAGSNGAASFVDILTVTGAGPRVRFDVDLKLDGSGKNASSATQGMTIEALPGANLQLISYSLLGIGATAFTQVAECETTIGTSVFAGNRICSGQASMTLAEDESRGFDIRTRYTFEATAGSAVWLSKNIGASASGPDSGMNLSNTGVFVGLSGADLTGVVSQQAGALRSVDGHFSYEEVHALGVTAAVPEPAEWALMLAGTALVAGFARRRQGQLASRRLALMKRRTC